MEISKGRRNRALSVLSSLFIYAEIRGRRHPGSNQCAGMRRHEMRFQAGYLGADGYAALGRVCIRLRATLLAMDARAEVDASFATDK